MSGTAITRWLCLGLVTVLAAGSYAQQPRPPRQQQPAPTLPEMAPKRLIYRGQPSVAHYQESRYTRELVFSDDTTITGEMLKRELKWTDAAGDTRIVWAEATPWSPAGGAPVIDVAVWEKEGGATLLLALANTYYPRKRIVEIDPATAAPAIAPRRVQRPDGGWEPAPVEAATLLDVTSEPDLDRQVGGTREIRLSVSGSIVTLDVTPVASPALKLAFDTVAGSWSVRPRP